MQSNIKVNSQKCGWLNCIILLHRWSKMGADFAGTNEFLDTVFEKYIAKDEGTLRYIKLTT